MVKLKTMSDRSRLRFNSGSFINYHGKQSFGSGVRPKDMNSRSEDMVCEWMVGEVKESLRSMGGNYTEETIDKKMRATPLVNELLKKDNASLLIPSTGPGSSWDRFDEEEISRFRKYGKQIGSIQIFPFLYLGYIFLNVLIFFPSGRISFSLPKLCCHLRCQIEEGNKKV